MGGLCLTAGTGLADIIWAAHVLPALRRADPGLRLFWECPVPGHRRLLCLYPEIDLVVGDAGELAPPPEDYLILHPLWHRADPGADPLASVFALAGRFCGAPAAPPARPYLPVSPADLPAAPELPPAFICMEPPAGDGRGDGGRTLSAWAALAARLPLPVVQVGRTRTPLLDGAVDARGEDAAAAAAAVGRAQLCIGVDSDSSALAQALGRPQIWLTHGGGAWLWPRGQEPLCSLCVADASGSLDIQAVADLALRKLGAGGADRAV